MLCNLAPYTLHLIELFSLCIIITFHYCYQNISKNDKHTHHQEFGKFGYLFMYINVALAGILFVLIPIAKFIESPYDISITMAKVTYFCILFLSISSFFWDLSFESQPTYSQHWNFVIKLPTINGYYYHTLDYIPSLDPWTLSVLNKISVNNVYIFLCATYTIRFMRDK